MRCERIAAPNFGISDMTDLKKAIAIIVFILSLIANVPPFGFSAIYAMIPHEPPKMPSIFLVAPVIMAFFSVCLMIGLVKMRSTNGLALAFASLLISLCSIFYLSR